MNRRISALGAAGVMGFITVIGISNRDRNPITPVQSHKATSLTAA
jgi:hypothetical protein